jgi:manganese-dependent ADP-ribose/CDP-alcohol diphosphatase
MKTATVSFNLSIEKFCFFAILVSSLFLSGEAFVLQKDLPTKMAAVGASSPDPTTRSPAALATKRTSSLGEESPTDSFEGIVKELAPPSGPPRFTAGVIADIQYAPIPDGFSFSGAPRYYRHALEAAKHAAEHFERDKIDMVLNLGDTIDGKCQDIVGHGGDQVPEGVDAGHMSIDHVLEALSAYQSGPMIHTYGNHCLYNLDRKQLGDKLGLKFVEESCGALVGYSHYVRDGIRFVVLDTYDIAIMQRCERTCQKRKEASKILSKNNPNYPANMNSPEGLEGNEKRFVGFGGGVGSIQLSWLRQTLDEARTAGEKVIIVSHQPILPGSSNPVCLVWNFDEVLEVLRDFGDIVVASFSGHAHKGGYSRDPQSGIHFRVIEAVLESCPEKTYAIMDVYDDRLILRGYGHCESAVYDFEHTRKAVKRKAGDL